MRALLKRSIKCAWTWCFCLKTQPEMFLTRLLAIAKQPVCLEFFADLNLRAWMPLGEPRHGAHITPTKGISAVWDYGRLLQVRWSFLDWYCLPLKTYLLNSLAWPGAPR